MAIWQGLVSDHVFAAGYQSVRRFVRKLPGPQRPEAPGIILTSPGKEAQVDYIRSPMQSPARRTLEVKDFFPGSPYTCRGAMTVDKPPDDGRLVEIIQIGTRAEAEAALEQLYVRHASHLFGYLLSRGFTKEEQQEIANDVWHRAWQRMSKLRFHSEIGFFPWLRGIAKNVVKERFRSKYLRARVTAELAGTETEDVSDLETFSKDPAAAEPFEHAMIRSLNRAEFRKLVEELLPEAPADYRELINAKFFCGFTVEEIAQLNEWKPSKVHLTTYRALRWLREKLVERHGPDVSGRWFVW